MDRSLAVGSDPALGPDRKGVSISKVSQPLPEVSQPSPDSEIPKGPWIVVIGMHRSGTSALTGVLGGLGLTLPQPSDRWGPEPSNPEHFESASMVWFDEHLIEFLEGNWDAPPPLPSGWEERPELKAFDDEACRAARCAFSDDGPVVWKDPRACLLLPYWRRLLPRPLAAVLMWRSPTEVANSLHQRDGLDWTLGTALWESYNKTALDVLEGTPVYVASYGELLEEPADLCRALGDWLDSLEWLASWRGTWNPERAADAVSDALRHQRPESEGPLLDSQVELVERLGQLRGAHSSLPSSGLPPISPWVSAVLEEHRSAVLLSRRLDAVQGTPAPAEGANQQKPTIDQPAPLTSSGRRTRPLWALSARRSRKRDAR